MKAHQLGLKRHKKALKRKNKKYTGPKYSHLEQMVMLEPLLAKAGIELFAEQKKEFRLQETTNAGKNESKTSFV